jgi:hypothetical protein
VSVEDLDAALQRLEEMTSHFDRRASPSWSVALSTTEALVRRSVVKIPTSIEIAQRKFGRGADRGA